MTIRNNNGQEIFEIDDITLLVIIGIISFTILFIVKN